jgi:hypothetical protein
MPTTALLKHMPKGLHMDWVDLIKNGTIEDLFWEAHESMDMGFPVPVDVLAILHAAGYII